MSSWPVRIRGSAPNYLSVFDAPAEPGDPLDERGHDDDGRREARDFAEDGKETEEKEGAVLGEEERRIPDDGRQRAERDGTSRRSHGVDHRARTVELPPAGHVHGVVDADPGRDRERDEV